MVVVRADLVSVGDIIKIEHYHGENDPLIAVVLNARYELGIDDVNKRMLVMSVRDVESNEVKDLYFVNERTRVGYIKGGQ